jgi:YVTN family beta-propeller protein
VAPSASPSPSPSASPSGPPPVLITPEATITIEKPLFMATDGDVPWLVNEAGEIVRLDPNTNAIGASGRVGPPGDPYQSLAATADGVWVTDWDTQHVFRVDPDTLQVTDTITAGIGLKGVIVTDAGVWVADTRGGAVVRIDPATNQVAASVPAGFSGPAGPNWLGSGLGSVWVDIPNNGTVTRINPDTDTVQATIKPPAEFIPCGGIAVGTDAVWVTGCAEQKQLIRIDPATNTSAVIIKLAGYGYYPTMINGAPWVSLDRGGPRNGQIVRINPLTDSVDRVLVPDAAFGGGGNLVVAAGAVWVSDPFNGAVIRLTLSAFGS